MRRQQDRGPGRAKVRPINRVIDCVILLLLLPVLLPVGLLIAAVVFADSPGSVFYRASRIGLNGHPFQMLKFRTMKSGCKGPGISTSFDPRFTPVGRFLARYRLDELPQFWNVVKGDMRVRRFCRASSRSTFGTSAHTALWATSRFSCGRC